MRILITNDDGIHADGLVAMREIASALSSDIWVVAPETDQSGAAHSLSLREPLRLRQIDERTFAVRGTPTDCVIMGVRHLLKDNRPTLVLSGVNAGSNMADDVSYSGTIAGAMEGTMLGIPSIALSLARGFDVSGTTKWETAVQHGAPLIKRLLATGWPSNVLVNINFPDCGPDAVVGTAVTAQGKRDQDIMRIDERHDTWGVSYFWFGFDRKRSNPKQGTDLWAIYSDRISITPLHLNLTHEATREDLARILND
jgi:5'-nucleotidase